MVVTDYADNRPALIAKERLPKVRAQIQQRREVQAPLPAACSPSIDIQALLEQRPSFFLAELVAGQYPTIPEVQRERYLALLDGYVWLALNRDRVPLAKFQNSPTFRASELRQRYLVPKASARFVTDWIFDDFKVRNQAFFTLHHVVVELSVTQADPARSRPAFALPSWRRRPKWESSSSTISNTGRDSLRARHHHGRRGQAGVAPTPVTAGSAVRYQSIAKQYNLPAPPRGPVSLQPPFSCDEFHDE